MRVFARRAALALAALSIATATGAQSPTPFTVEDMLKLSTISVLDITEDGSRIAATVRRPIDNDSMDHRRFGDPTYLAPARVTLQVIDARSGAVVTPFKELVNVRDAAWTRDGKRLAVLVAKDVPVAGSRESYPAASLFVWDADRKALAELTPKPAQPIAVNTSIAWTPDGAALVVTLRDRKIDAEARETFRRLTDGPIVVHKSSDAFLEWDLLARQARTRSIASIDAATGAVKSIVPESRLSSYQFARDGSFLTVMEDVTAKTDYDVIGGSENVLKRVDAKTGESKIVVEAKDLKGLTLRWTDDGRRFAYAKRGEVFVQDLDGGKARSLTPKATKPEAEAAKEPETETGRSGDSTAKPGEESFTPVSFSRDGAKLLMTSRKGWYVVSVADGARQLIVPMEEDEEKNPRLTAIDWAPDGGAIFASWGSAANGNAASSASTLRAAA